MANMFELVDNCRENAVIKVIGVGGGGGNAVEHMLEANVDGVEFVCANTDAQALNRSSAKTTIQLGSQVTKGLGAGANPSVGRQAAIEDRERIADVLQDTDMVFITAGMGGGTGTGAAPVIAEIAKEMEILTVAVVTKPFFFEMKKRMQAAELGIEELRQHVDSLIIVPNDKVLNVMKGKKLTEAFSAANDVLHGAVQGIAELMTCPGLINVDFADVKTVMSETGTSMMGNGTGSGEDRARRAAELAVSSPLLEDVDLAGAKGILVNITSGEDMSIDEFSEVGSVIQDFAADDATVVIGTAIDADLNDEIRVTVVATGIGQHQVQAPKVKVDNTRKADGTNNYSELERPTILREQATQPKQVVGGDMDYLDIPAFLRNQAD
jgi:cell division protein FtsZ